MKISFIIPIYNAELYIVKCVNSILSQSYRNLEIILINDGSLDSTPLICDELSCLDERVKVIHQNNKGTSSSRNIGLKSVTGDYVWFVDADDYLKFDCLDKLASVLSENSAIEILNFLYAEFFEGKEFDKISNGTDKKYISGLNYLKKNDGRLFLWNHIYRYSFLVEHNLSFVEGTKNVEDLLFNIKAFLLAKSVLELNIVCYVYNLTNINSTSRKRTKEHLIKLAEDSMVIHYNLHELSKNISLEESGVVDFIIRKSCAGFFFSLLRFKYDIEFVKSIILIYEKEKLYPVGWVKEFKTNLFLLLVNNKYLYLLFCRLHLMLC